MRTSENHRQIAMGAKKFQFRRRPRSAPLSGEPSGGRPIKKRGKGGKRVQRRPKNPTRREKGEMLSEPIVAPARATPITGEAGKGGDAHKERSEKTFGREKSGGRGGAAPR